MEEHRSDMGKERAGWDVELGRRKASRHVGKTRMPITSEASDRGRGVAGHEVDGDRVGFVDVQGRGHNTVEIDFRISD